MSGEYEIAGYEGLLPPQQQWFDRLMSMPMGQWPEPLREYVSGKRPGCGDELAHYVGCWVKEQQD